MTMKLPTYGALADQECVNDLIDRGLRSVPSPLARMFPDRFRKVHSYGWWGSEGDIRDAQREAREALGIVDGAYRHGEDHNVIGNSLTGTITVDQMPKFYSGQTDDALCARLFTNRQKSTG